MKGTNQVNPIHRREFLGTTAIAGLSCIAKPCLGAQERTQATPRVAHGASVAATVHPIATDAAIEILTRGGNAIDAAIAAALTLSVVDGHNSGIGGGCFMIIAKKIQGRSVVVGIDGRETAPMKAHRDMYLRDGKPDTSLSQTGGLACGVPGEIASFDYAHRVYGNPAITWKDLFQPAIRAASEGYAIKRSTANAIQNEREILRRFPGSASVLLKPDGSPLKIGDRLIQKDLAATLEQIAEQGSAWFYRGEFARKTADYLKSIGGIMSENDFAEYHCNEFSNHLPQSNYRDHLVLGFPPPSSGGVHVAQILNILKEFPVADLYRETPVKFYHLLAESMKIAFADRAHWLGDPKFAKVPRGIADEGYGKELAAKIDMTKVRGVDRYGAPPNLDHVFDSGVEKHTTHLTVADRDGNWVGITATINTTWGSKVIVPGTGVMLNNQMDDFSIAPGTPNAFGLIGAEANAIEPGKRPLSSMSPTMVLKSIDGGESQPVLTCGAAGGPKIISATLQTIVRVIDLDQSIGDALASPRVHHQWQPDQLMVETSLPESIQKDLSNLGHHLKTFSSMAIAQGIQRTSNELIAASDSRTEGSAKGCGA